MERAIPFVICTALILLAGMTMASDSFAILDTSTRELAATYERNETIRITNISSLSTSLLPIEHRNLEVSLTNDGRTSIADFSKWDVIVQYFDSQNNYYVYWLPYVEGPPDLNQWSVKGIYLDAANSTPELLEAGILNPDEDIIVELKLSPSVHESRYNLAIISTPGGVSTWNHFRSYPLYLHNNPTPPTANTTAQETLPLSTTAPTAATLYNYDEDYSSDLGRRIEQGRGNVNESNLARYQTWRAGPLTEPVGDTLEFDTVNGMAPAVTHVSGDVYAIAYEGPGSDGFLKTVEIAPSGNITDAVIDTLEFDTGTGQEPSIIHVSGNVYAIAYRGTGDNGFLTTVDIATSGNITDAVIDTLEFDAVTGREPGIIHVSGDVYAIAYRGPADNGFLTTVEIAASGQITDAVIDTLEFDSVNGQEPSIIHVSGNVYAIAYRGPADDGFLKTVEIAPSGNITDAVIDTLEFDTGT
ncbi:MAG: hypothetical protein KKF26_04885, partial [Chloroflexi bacterium]|nr:hypothetical protein [Chloroflexota bacterium]